ncbi:MAG: transcriptional repressor [Lachnospiraceae bacterium]|nr:transcriptional repressor [Lachnospiraceae bacterium]MDY5497470.1 transcriptional repressor [Anaerobutyricum sp.]
MQRKYKTKASREIEAYIAAQKEKSFCAMDVYSYLTQRHVEINLATIYRNLEKMTEYNELVKFKTADRESYMYRAVHEGSGCHEHLHMQCRKCGAIFHLDHDFMNEIAAHLSGKYGFSIDCDDSVFIGICKKCQDKMTIEKTGNRNKK